MTPDVSEEDLALIRQYWPALPDELITPSRARLARERAAEEVDAATRSGGTRQYGGGTWVKGNSREPLALAGMEESAQTCKPRPERDWSDSTSDALAVAILLGLFVIACCCGAGTVGALWAVTG